MLRELSAQECEAMLRRHRLGRVAMRDAAGAYVVPISYAWDEGIVYAHAAPGRKVQLMRRWPHVAFQLDEVEDASCWRSVLVRGRFEEIHDEEGRAHARMLLLKAFEGHLMSVTAGHGQRIHLADAVMFCIRPEEVTGRAEGL